MSAFNPYRRSETLETSALLTAISRTTSPIVQATLGAAQLYEVCQRNRRLGGGAGLDAIALAALTLPDGRLNASINLPLLARRFKYLGIIGEGASAQALLAEDTFRSAGHVVTLKCFKRQHRAVALREARTLRYLHSRRQNAPGIVKLLGAFVVGGHVCLALDRLHPRFLEWVTDLAIAPHLQKVRALRKIGYQMLGTVAYMHACGVVHADIKPDNILFKTDSHQSQGLGIAFVDFGGAFSPTETDMENMTAEIQTLPYRAPEAALGCPCGPPIDCWSVGVVLAEAALARPLFPASTPLELLQLMASQLGPLPREMVANSLLGSQVDLSPLVMPPPMPSAACIDTTLLPLATLEAILRSKRAAVDARSAALQNRFGTIIQELYELDPCFADLVAGLLQYDAAKRPTASEALQHAWFRDLNPSLVDPAQQTAYVSRKDVPNRLTVTHSQPPNILELNVPRSASLHRIASQQIKATVAADSSVAGGTVIKAPSGECSAPTSSAIDEVHGRNRKGSGMPEHVEPLQKGDFSIARELNIDGDTSASTKRLRRERGDKPWWMV